MANKTSDQQVITFASADLIKDARQIFGVNPEVMAGALYQVNEPLSVDEAKKKLDAFLSRPIK
jgi:hypothetical protein